MAPERAREKLSIPSSIYLAIEKKVRWVIGHPLPFPTSSNAESQDLTNRRINRYAFFLILMGSLS